MTQSEWRNNGLGIFGGSNSVLEADGFYISYNQRPSPGFSLFQSDDGGPETALVRNGEFFILNGDFRDAYERLVPLGFDRCKEFYDQQAAYARSGWSDGKAA